MKDRRRFLVLVTRYWGQAPFSGLVGELSDLPCEGLPSRTFLLDTTQQNKELSRVSTLCWAL